MVESSRKKKQLAIFVIFIVIILGIIMFGLWVSDSETRVSPEELREQMQNNISSNYNVDSRDTVSDSETWISRSEKRFAGVERENEELKSQLNRIMQKLDSLENLKYNSTPVWVETPVQNTPVLQQTEEVKKDDLNQTDDIQKSLSTLPNPANYYSNNPARGLPTQTQQIKVYDFKDVDALGKEKDLKNVTNYIPAGAFATVVLLSGLDAPTGGQAMSNPVPVLLRVMDMGQLPNYFESGIKDCHMIGAGYGDLSSERGNIRLEKMSCVLKNGDVMETTLNGYLTGEDGKAGLRGRLVSKQGSVIAKALLAGVASGMSDSINSQYQNISTSALGSVQTLDSSKVVQSGLSKGASNALEKIADFYIARANEMYPIIEIDANRIGEAVLTSGSKLEFNLIGTTRTTYYDE